MAMIIRKYGWLPDVPSHLDYAFAEYHAEEVQAELPPAFSLAQYRSQIEDQGAEGSCTGHGWSSAYEATLKATGKPQVQLSRQGMYFNIRNLEGTLGYDAGGQIRDGAKALQTWGIWLESLQPYKAGDFKKKPSAAAYKDGLTRKGGSYYRCNSLQDIKTALVMKLPVVIGFAVYSQFESSEVAHSGVLNMPKMGEKMLGGHCVYIEAYDNATQRVTCVNSWGRNWGAGGTFTMPYEYLTSGLSDDWWACKTS